MDGFRCCFLCIPVVAVDVVEPAALFDKIDGSWAVLPRGEAVSALVLLSSTQLGPTAVRPFFLPVGVVEYALPRFRSAQDRPWMTQDMKKKDQERLIIKRRSEITATTTEHTCKRIKYSIHCKKQILWLHIESHHTTLLLFIFPTTTCPWVYCYMVHPTCIKRKPSKSSFFILRLIEFSLILNLFSSFSASLTFIFFFFHHFLFSLLFLPVT